MKTLEEYKTWLQNLISSNQEDEYLEFVWEIMKSPYTEFHYKLIINKNLNKEFRTILRSRFNEHIDAEDFLIQKLDTNQDFEYHADILFILGKINKNQKKKILNYSIEFTKSENDYKRNRALVVLGWIGGVAQTKILEEHLLNDENRECRAWSASSYMQMWFNKRKVKEKAYSAFEKALIKEKDLFVISCILTSIREIGRTKLGISQKELDNLNIEKINSAKEKAMRHIKKELNKK